LTNPRRLALERFPVRAREVSVTLSAWRLAVASEEGEGTVTRVEISSGGVLHRGEGIFLGWPQERLAAAYEAMMPIDEPTPPETLQLG
jgi:hypothetical protein